MIIGSVDKTAETQDFLSVDFFPSLLYTVSNSTPFSEKNTYLGGTDL